MDYKELTPVISKLIHSDNLTRLRFIAYLHASSMVQPIGKLCLSRNPVYQQKCRNTM